MDGYHMSELLRQPAAPNCLEPRAESINLRIYHVNFDRDRSIHELLRLMLASECAAIRALRRKPEPSRGTVARSPKLEKRTRGREAGACMLFASWTRTAHIHLLTPTRWFHPPRPTQADRGAGVVPRCGLLVAVVGYARGRRRLRVNKKEGGHRQSSGSTASRWRTTRKSFWTTTRMRSFTTSRTATWRRSSRRAGPP